jgi:hypothetical protein
MKKENIFKRLWTWLKSLPQMWMIFICAGLPIILGTIFTGISSLLPDSNSTYIFFIELTAILGTIFYCSTFVFGILFVIVGWKNGW